MVRGSPWVTGQAREGRTEPRRERAARIGSLVLVIRPLVLAVVLSGWAWAIAAVPLQTAARESDEPDVILAIKEKAFQVVKGNAAREDSHVGFSLAPGGERYSGTPQ